MTGFALPTAVLRGVDMIPKRLNQGRNDWSAKDKLNFVAIVIKHGKDWNKLNAAFPDRDPAAVKKFWTNHHKNLKLEELLDQRSSLDLASML